MTSLSISKDILSNKYYCKIATNIFEKYTYLNFKDLLFWDVIYIDFEDQTKKKLANN